MRETGAGVMGFPGEGRTTAGKGKETNSPFSLQKECSRGDPCEGAPDL